MTLRIRSNANEPKQTTDAKALDVPVEMPETAAKNTLGFPIVGIGASAGGLAAFEAFFSGMPADADPGMAFVLVQHLAPDHKSILTDLVRRYTRMQVFEVEDGMAVKPNCTYIIPPNRDMAFLNGALQLMEPSAPRGQRLPIDFFFRSLAQDRRELAICIVLSGTGSDGSLGVRAIKGEGGMVMAQNPASTEYDGMPRSAIATGLVDYELPPAEMPTQLITYVAHAFGKLPRLSTVPAPKTENALKKIFILLRAQTSHDFCQYKPSTIHRRIERRMAVHQIETIDGYVAYLQQTPAEVEALFRDLLIGVTNFFRDPEAFQALEEQVIPKLFAGKPAGAVIRVWSPGCSTGEEAYSIAILLQERLEALKQSYKVQVFATDIDSRAIATARVGIYPASIAADISPERLARFFAAEPDGSAYRIHKDIRDMLVFSEQDVIKDPPLSKLDLISCRNFLIYMDMGLQKKLIPLFHYTLLPCGFLFLGISETVGEFGDLFAVLDRKLKLYQRKEDIHSAKRATPGRFLQYMTAIDIALPRSAGKTADAGKPPLRELTEQALLQQVAPACALVNGQGDILYLHGRTGRYLEPAPGEAGINNILKMAREGLRLELTTALRRAASGNEIVRHPGLRVKTNGDFTTVNLAVRPVAAGPAVSSEPPLYLVILEEAPPFDPEQPQMAAALQAGEGADGPDMEDDARIAALKQELRAKEEYLQTSNEELRAFNEEMQSVNEELQSTNEEIETSKEELQSVNEELATVNAELQTKVADLSRTNNDMNNLLAATGVDTVFVDHQLRILRFTPDATQIINLIPSDVGRPVAHLVSNLTGYDHLAADTQTVLDTLVPKEMEVRTRAGARYTMRIQPYRTPENMIEGAVITFVDITERKRAEEALRKTEERFRSIVETANEGIWYMNPDFHFTYINRAVTEILGYTPAEMIGRHLLDLIPEDERTDSLQRMADRREGGHDTFERIYRHRNGSLRTVLVSAAPVIADGGFAGSFAMLTDITERKRAEVRNELTRDVLALLNHPEGDADIIRDIVQAIKKRLNFDAVGIRLREGDDFPYYETSGFPDHFVEMERFLCERDAAGAIVRDAQGNAVLECMCGNILCGRTDPAQPFFTEGGSFWSNCTTELLASTTEKDRQARTRDRCNGADYESVALIPLRTGDEILGLLQLNDLRRNQFTPERIRFFEGLGASIGIALARMRAEEALRASESRLRQLAVELSRVEQREQQRLAMCLHDEVAQTLALLQIKLGTLAETLGASPAQADIAQIRDLLEKTLDQARSLVFDLSPPILHQLGLEAAVEWVGEKICRDHKLIFVCRDNGEPKPMDDEWKLLLFRCARELMMNTIKHAKATRLTAAVERLGDRICVTVEDDGCGFDVSRLDRWTYDVGFGLFSVRERLTAAGGRCEIDSKPGCGTRVKLTLLTQPPPEQGSRILGVENNA
jgi:two-component system CheB/CheR fusion protein